MGENQKFADNQPGNAQHIAQYTYWLEMSNKTEVLALNWLAGSFCPQPSGVVVRIIYICSEQVLNLYTCSAISCPGGSGLAALLTLVSCGPRPLDWCSQQL